MSLQVLIPVLRKLLIKRNLIIGLVATVLLLPFILFTSAKAVFAQTIADTNELIKKISEGTSAPEIFLSEKQPKLLAKETVVEMLYIESKNSKNSVLSYIDTGFSRKSETESYTADRISDIKLYYYVTNNSDVRDRMTINTGIQKDVLKYLRVEGATGYRWENNELVIAYVPLAAGKSSLVTITAIPTISHEPISIETAPVLKDRSGQLIQQGVRESKTVQLESSVDLQRLNSVNKKVNNI
jgi:hypothetical protein